SPSTKHQTNPKCQILIPNETAVWNFAFGFWSLFGFWLLVLGAFGQSGSFSVPSTGFQAVRREKVPHQGRGVDAATGFAEGLGLFAARPGVPAPLNLVERDLCAILAGLVSMPLDRGAILGRGG